MRMTKHIFGLNFSYPDFLLKELLQLSKEISDTLKDSLIKKNKVCVQPYWNKAKGAFLWIVTIQNILPFVFLSS